MQYFQRLRDIREDHDLTQKQVADVLGILQTHYSRYERGAIELPMRHFITLARFYDISLDYLAGLTNTPHTIDGKPYTVTTNKNITITQTGNGHISIKN